MWQQKYIDGVNEIIKPENFKEWCKAVGRLYSSNYSFRNTVLIYLQSADAGNVKSVEAWKLYGRTVKAGAKGVEIVFPEFLKEEKPGTLVTDIVKKVDAGFGKSPGKEYISVPVQGTCISVNGYVNNKYDVLLSGHIAKSQISEEDLRNFLKYRINNKIPVGFSMATVYDESETETPDFLWVKPDTPIIAGEVIRENGTPVFNKNGEIRILNSERRKRTYPGNLVQDMESVADNPLLISTINATLEEEIKEKSDIDLGADRTSKESTIDLARSVLNSSNNDFQRFKAEAAAYIFGSKIGIDYDLQNDYLQKWSNGKKAEEIAYELSDIYNQAKELFTTIQRRNGLKNFTDLVWSNKDIWHLYQCDIPEQVKHILDEHDSINMILNSAQEELANTKDQRLSSIIKDQINLCLKVKKELQIRHIHVKNLEKILNSSNPGKDEAEITRSVSVMSSQQRKIANMKMSIDKLSEERVNYVVSTLSQKMDVKERFRHRGMEVLNRLKKVHPELNKLSEFELKLMAKSYYVSWLAENLLGENDARFVEKAISHITKTMQVQSNNNTIVEILSCENWEDKPIFTAGCILHPRVANDIIRNEEERIRQKREDAAKEGKYYPPARCLLRIYTKGQRAGLPILQTSIDIGDAEQSDLLEHLKQSMDSTSNQKSRKAMEYIISNYEEALHERVEKLILEPGSINGDSYDRKDEISTNKMSEWKGGMEYKQKMKAVTDPTEKPSAKRGRTEHVEE